jgi:hypothetical protein
MVKRSGREVVDRPPAGSVMFTRRTATVTISAPAASTARRVSSNERYLPVPTISRERYSRPASVKGSTLVMDGSAASDEMDHLDRVAVAQRGAQILRARNKSTNNVDAMRRAPARAPSPVGHRRTVRQRARLVVHRHLHRTRRVVPGGTRGSAA